MSTYVYPNFKSKKALKEAIAKGEKVTFRGQSMMDNTPDYSTFTGKILDLMGPHYPEPHKWYANVILENGKVVKVI